MLSDLLSRTPKEIECRDFVIPDPPASPEAFERWKLTLYNRIHESARRDPEECLQWISQVERAKEVGELAGKPTPWSSVDGQLKAQIPNILHGLKLIQYKQLQSAYMANCRVVNGRQLLWSLVQDTKWTARPEICTNRRP